MDNTYAAFCLDEAIIQFGEALEAEMDRVEDKAKTAKAAEGAKKLVLEKWLKVGAYAEGRGEKPQQFRNPVPTK